MRPAPTIFIGSLFLALLAPAAMAEVKLPKLIGDHMVIQREAKFTAWGTAKPGEKITVSIGDNKAQAVAAADGKWLCQLAAMPASDKPVDLIVKGDNTLTVKDILVGDVWFCSGQSNMGLVLPLAEHGKEDAAKSENPNLRLFRCQGGRDNTPQDDIKGYMWQECNPKNVADFSAVAYYFGKKLNEELKIPIGLVAAGYGGTAIEQWMPDEAYKTDPALADFAAEEAAFPAKKAEWDKKYAEYEAKKAEALAKDPKATQGKGLPYAPNPIYPPSNFNCQLYNSSVIPLRNVALAGIIWYQGESNVGDAAGYTKQFPAMIRHWKKNIGQEDLPFLFVQIADGATTSTANDPNRSNPMSELRASQLAALALPKTAMIVTLDVCEPNTAHPKYKEPVAARLAQAALVIKYGRDIPNYSSPLMDAMKIDGDKMVLKFKHATGGLVAKSAAGEKVTGFAIAGPDGKFALADATIDGDTITLSAPSIKNPVRVRYAWGLAPAYSVFNKANLPLGTFESKTTDK